MYKNTTLTAGTVVLDFTIDAHISTEIADPNTELSIAPDSLALWYSYYSRERFQSSGNQKQTKNPSISTPPARPPMLSIYQITVKKNAQYPVEVLYIINQ